MRSLASLPQVVESTAAVHNVLVCTLCSCYPRSILGMSPSWYWYTQDQQTEEPFRLLLLVS